MDVFRKQVEREGVESNLGRVNYSAHEVLRIFVVCSTSTCYSLISSFLDFVSGWCTVTGLDIEYLQHIKLHPAGTFQPFKFFLNLNLLLIASALCTVTEHG